MNAFSWEQTKESRGMMLNFMYQSTQHYNNNEQIAT